MSLALVSLISIHEFEKGFPYLCLQESNTRIKLFIYVFLLIAGQIRGPVKCTEEVLAAGIDPEIQTCLLWVPMCVMFEYKRSHNLISPLQAPRYADAAEASRKAVVRIDIRIVPSSRNYCA